MMDPNGDLHPVSMKKAMQELLSKGDSARLVQLGDKFYIRGCEFEVVSFTKSGIIAKGIPDNRGVTG